MQNLKLSIQKTDIFSNQYFLHKNINLQNKMKLNDQPSKDKFRRQVVLDGRIVHKKDLRQRVDSGVYPYDCNGLIKFNLNGKENIGTGSIIAPDLVLTVAYNVVHCQKQDIVACKNIRFYPNVNGGDIGNQYKVIEVRIDQKYIQNYQRNDQEEMVKHNYALLKLNKLVKRDKYLSITSNFSNNISQISIFGFPQEKMNNESMDQIEQVGASGEALELRGDYIEHLVDATLGQSGSPILIETDGQWYIIGLHNGWKEKNGRKYGVNFGSLITEEKMDKLLEWERELMTTQFSIFKMVGGKLVADPKEGNGKGIPKKDLQKEYANKLEKEIQYLKREKEEREGVHEAEIKNLMKRMKEKEERARQELKRLQQLQQVQPVHSMLPNKFVFEWDMSTKWASKFKVQGQTATLKESIGNWCQLTSKHSLPQDITSQIVLRINYNGGWGIKFGVITTSRKEEMQTSGGQEDSLGYRTYMSQKAGRIWLDGKNIQETNAKYFVKEGGELAMEVSPSQLTFKFTNGKTIFMGEFAKKWKNQKIYPYVTMHKKGASVSVL